MIVGQEIENLVGFGVEAKFILPFLGVEAKSLVANEEEFDTYSRKNFGTLFFDQGWLNS